MPQAQNPINVSKESRASNEEKPKRKPRLSTRFFLLVRRAHLYAGLFLLPWVFLYGVTGAMFSHEALLPEASIQSIEPSVVATTSMSQFPTPNDLAGQVVQAIRESSPDSEVVRDTNYDAEFTGPLMFEVKQDSERFVIKIDPLDHGATVAAHTSDSNKPKKLLGSVKNIAIEPSPMVAAKEAVPAVLESAGITSQNNIRPLGWTKLNFIAHVNGEPARVTYVLKDGHVDVASYSGHHGMSARGFFLRLHTTHGQPPHWNGRMFWIVIADAMAIAMVTWGITGLIMWSRMKRTRLIGSIVIMASLITAVSLYLAAGHFYASTLL